MKTTIKLMAFIFTFAACNVITPAPTDGIVDTTKIDTVKVKARIDSSKVGVDTNLTPLNIKK